MSLIPINDIFQLSLPKELENSFPPVVTKRRKILTVKVWLECGRLQKRLRDEMNNKSFSENKEDTNGYERFYNNKGFDLTTQPPEPEYGLQFEIIDGKLKTTMIKLNNNKNV